MIRELDLAILEILFEDGRTPVERIAVMTGRKTAEVAAAIAEMEDAGIILKYPTMINWDLLDKESVEALIEVRVTPQRDAGFDAIAERIYRFDEVSSVYLMSGAYDLMVIIKADSMKKLSYFVAEKLSTIEHVLSTSTHFILKKYKSDGVLFERGAQDHRLVVSP